MAPDYLEQQFSRVKKGDLGIFGDPVEHSLSPVMQNAALSTWKEALKEKDHPPVYHKFLVKPEDLERAFHHVRERGLLGINITVPHKVASCKFVDRLDDFSKTMGAINTVLGREDGVLEGYNTDGEGFVRALQRDINFCFPGKSALVLGAGGTGRVIVQQLVDLNAEPVYWWNRTRSKWEGVSSRLRGDRVVQLLSTPAAVQEVVGRVDLIVNATSVGLRSDEGLPVDGLTFKPGQVAFDVIYNRETAFIKRAKEAGAIPVGGMGMLVYQGARSYEIWKRAPAPVEVMRREVEKKIKEGM